MSERVTHIGPYRVERELLRDERRVVYQGWQMSLNRPVQITQLTPETAAVADFVGHWKGAARDLRDPGHPQVPRILDAQFAGDQPHLVESYIVADTLADQLARERDLGSSLRLVAGLADALAYAHKRGWAHGQMGPEYVRVMEDGSAYVLDLPWQAAQRPKGDAAAMKADVQALARLLRTLRQPAAGALPAMTGRPVEDTPTLAAWLAYGESPEAASTAAAVAPVLIQAEAGGIANCERLAEALRPLVSDARTVASAATPPPNSTFVMPPPGAASRAPAPPLQPAPLTPPPPVTPPPYPYPAPPPARSSRGLAGALAAVVVVAVLAVGGYLLCRTGVLPFCASCDTALIAQYASAARIYVDKGSWQDAQSELRAALGECTACGRNTPAVCGEIKPLEVDVSCRLQVETLAAAGERLLDNDDACAASEKLEEALAVASQCQVDVTLVRSLLARNSDGGAYTICAEERLALAEAETDEEQRSQLCEQAHNLLVKAHDSKSTATLISQLYTRAERFAALQESHRAQQWDTASVALQALEEVLDTGQYCGYPIDGFRFDVLMGQGNDLSQQGDFAAALEQYQQAEQVAATLAQKNSVTQAVAALPAAALTPTATATPSATSTPAAAPTPFVTTNARIRSCPSTRCSELRKASGGATFPVVCSVAETDGAWYKLDNNQGWVRSDVATLSGQPVPCAAAAVTPTPQAAVASSSSSASSSASSGGSCRAERSLPPVSLSSPAVDKTCNGPVRFSWQASYGLQPGETFEVHIWPDFNQVRDSVRRTKDTSTVIDLRTDVRWINWTDNNRAHFWEVVVVCSANGVKVSQDPGARLFYFETRLSVDENNPDSNCK